MERGDTKPKDWRDSATVERLYRACRTDAERLLIAALGWAGLRRGGLHELRVRDVNLDMAHPSVYARMKGGRMVELPIARGVATALRPFILGRSPDDRVWPYHHRGWMATVLHRICDRAAVPRMYPHALRATFGHILRFERGVETETIRQLLGHRDQKTTRICIGEDVVDMRTAVETFDRPRAAPANVAAART
jgi:integrase